MNQELNQLKSLELTWESSKTNFEQQKQPGINHCKQCALLVRLFFGYYPARKAANSNPIEALRFE